MTKVIVDPSCGNSPKAVFVRDFNIAFGTADTDFLVQHVADDIVWTIHGDKVIEGKEAFKKAVEEMKDYVAEEIEIASIVTHGKAAASNGEMLMKDGSRYAYCDMYEFVSPGKHIIRTLKSYVIKTS
ncbi:nuclear transport factor 2 family protein [Roseivirga pacifica]|uniref:nuclear transport factor 2 family protein n=1 Tax=Roseivirga pacifica TaxID=1267423 RepID=UPI0020956B51|nr:nuclear transport factor 2 family protein [Roseivirga pacifica]MCO6360963.1 nuclear transport factor 2 family protein [Roseivirga pacifica]MCO6368852.1 nuclear transport factor 2 family protein [Roseivirga pacifica]MCO6372996.1 nuclear transport factor 2 family protein [Roseivirga pacifica]MCO6377056.1 nuclear transport factor 2 family protein [Roseivirga pacifica]MCO6377667.1 nuclear transport factor 2 family protein [Roseivirga pacifica]